MKLKTIIELMDVKTLIASILPVLYGTAYAWYKYDVFDLTLLICLLVAMILIQSATNMVNDCSDYESGADQSDLLIDEKVLARGETSVKEVARLAIVFVLVSFVIGLYIAFRTSYAVLIVGLIGGIIALLYSLGPLPISHLPIGELVSGTTMGVGITSTVIYVQSGFVSLETVLVALPLALFIGTVLLSNNLSDIVKDKEQGRKTLSILIGVEKSEILWIINVLSILIVITGLFFVGIFPAPVIFFVLALFSFKNFTAFLSYKKSIKTKERTMKIIAIIGVRIHIAVIIGLIVGKLIQ